MSLAFCPTLDELVRTRRAVGRTGRVYDGLPALSTTNNLRTIQRLMAELKPAKTLEIGLSFGGSALAFCAAHEVGGQHTAIDPFQTTHWDSCGLMAIERAGFGVRFTFLDGYSSIELPRLLQSDERFGLIYVDGSHLFEDVFIDAYYGARLLTDGGVILFDDSTDQHVAKVIRFLRSNTPLVELNCRNDLRYHIAKMFGKTQLTAFQRNGLVDREYDSTFRKF